MKWHRLLIAEAPLALTAVGAALLWAELLSNPVVVFRIDLGTLLILLGVTGSAIFASRSITRYRQHMLERSINLEASRDRRRFLARLDHELKNPLTAIRAGLANLTEAASSNIHEKALQSVNTQALRLSRLVADLRKLAELETQVLESGQVDLAGLLTEAVALAREHPNAEQVAVHLTLPHVPWPLPTVTGDWDLLFIVFHNLLDNALKFSRPGKTVEVRAYEDGANVVIEVADTGVGIPPDELPFVWEELYRGENAREIPGSGLGLALVRAYYYERGC